MKPMKMLKSLIEDWIYDGKPPVKGITPYQVDVLIDVYNGLIANGCAGFIQADILRVMQKCNIKTTPHGIGWLAHRP